MRDRHTDNMYRLGRSFNRWTLHQPIIVLRLMHSYVWTTYPLLTRDWIHRRTYLLLVVVVVAAVAVYCILCESNTTTIHHLSSSHHAKLQCVCVCARSCRTIITWSCPVQRELFRQFCVRFTSSKNIHTPNSSFACRHNLVIYIIKNEVISFYCDTFSAIQQILVEFITKAILKYDHQKWKRTHTRIRCRLTGVQQEIWLDSLCPNTKCS